MAPKKSITNKMKKTKRKHRQIYLFWLDDIKRHCFKNIGIKNVDLGPFYSNKICEMT